MAGFRTPHIPVYKRGYRGGYVPGFDVSGLDKVQWLVENIPAAAAAGLQRATVEVGTGARRRLKIYPGPPSYPLKWASKKQRAWYFAMRKEKGLPIEYTRINDPMSQRLRESWGMRDIPGGVILGNSAEYAPYVQSAQFQTEMHKATGWVTDEQVIDEMMSNGEIGKAIEAGIGVAIRTMIRSLG